MKTYQPIAIDVPEQGGAVAPGWGVEVEEERVHAVRRQTQAADVVPHGQLHGRRVHLLGRVPTHCKHTRWRSYSEVNKEYKEKGGGERSLKLRSGLKRGRSLELRSREVF